MSDARAATDAELLASLRAFVEQHRNGGDAPANVMRVMTLLHRLLDDNAADAARIRELEAALCACADDLEAELNNRYPPAIRKYPCMEIDYQRDMHSVHEARAMLAAAPRP